MKKLILIIEDSPEISQLIATILNQAGFDTIPAYTGQDGINLFESKNPNLVILDLMLPDLDGADICRHVRAKSSVPLIMVTARNEDMDKVVGLEIGADDYITKPFNKHELLARVRALLRRAEHWGLAVDGPRDRLRLHGLTLGPAERRVWVEDQEAILTHTEFDLLQLMMENPGLVITREQLLERIWGVKALDLDTRTVDNHIARLRKKLSGGTGDTPIETVPGVGYRFRAG